MFISYIFAAYKIGKYMLNTVIFDMDGLLIDSEPFWQEAGKETMAQFGVKLTHEQYQTSTGLRTEEWIEHWFRHFDIKQDRSEAVTTIITKAIEKIYQSAEPMPGVNYIFEYFAKRKFKIGLATSSPKSLVDVVTEKLNIGSYLQAISSAEHLPYGKPHPQVYLNCAEHLGSSPLECVCFEDSFFGMISAKAARMKCIVVPERGQQTDSRWGAADLRLTSLNNFNDLLLESLTK